MKRLIFLDIDGVLNGHEYYLSKAYKKLLDTYGHDMLIQICRKNLFWVSLLCRLTKAKIVVSSSWRYGWNDDGSVKLHDRGHDMVATDKLFRRYGVNIISVTPRGEQTLKNEHPKVEEKVNNWLNTPSFVGIDTKEDTLKYCRGTQILKWIEDNNYNGKYIIFEDDYHDVELYKELEKRLVITTFYGKKFGVRFKHFLIALIKLL